jgi:hypothetical protein
MAETDKPADKPAAAKPIVDVIHPGKSAPSGNSKSVIISSRPLLKDPMMLGDEAKPAEDNPSNSPPAKVTNSDLNPDSDKTDRRPPTAPLLESEMPDETPESAKPVPPPGPAAEPKPELKPKSEEVVKPPQPAASAAKPAVDGDKPDDDKPAAPDDDDKAQPTTAQPTAPTTADNPESAEADANADETGQPAKGSAQQLEAEATAKAKHQAAIEKLADSKQYYLPINTIEKLRSRRFVAFGIILSLLLIVAWADIALDAGLIQIHGLKPITHFFSN